MTNFYSLLKATRHMNLPHGTPFNLGNAEHGLEWVLSDGTTISLYADGTVQMGDGTYDELEFTNVILTLLGVVQAKQTQLAEKGEEKMRVQ